MLQPAEAPPDPPPVLDEPSDVDSAVPDTPEFALIDDAVEPPCPAPPAPSLVSNAGSTHAAIAIDETIKTHEYDARRPLMHLLQPRGATG